MRVEIYNCMHGDIILPVWSLDGINYSRCPSSAMPAYSGGIHRFTLDSIPQNTTFFHIAKFFPYTIPQFEAFRQRVLSSPLVKETQIGGSELGYPMYVWEIAKTETLSRVGSPRIYVQAGIHPSETTSYYVNEGFLDWLLFSQSPEAGELLDEAVVSVVPMCNPDGVSLGNYRTNSKSVNLETEFAAPYDSEVKESVALITLVEQYMGTTSSPGEHPILILMNLHSTHEDRFPYHFLHQPFYL
jgi:murein tripeptide amidase MpaA